MNDDMSLNNCFLLEQPAMVQLSLGREFAGREDDDLAPVHVVTGDLDDSMPSHILVLGVH